MILYRLSVVWLLIVGGLLTVWSMMGAVIVLIPLIISGLLASLVVLLESRRMARPPVPVWAASTNLPNERHGAKI